MTAGAPLIPVSTGRAVVTRTAGPFAITLMEHRADVRLERHRHEEAIVGLLLRGRYDERLDGRTVEPAKASLLVKPPETAHANCIGREGTDTILIQILPDRIPPEFATLLSRCGIRLDSRFHAIGRALLCELRSASPGEPLGLEALVTELLSIAQTRGPGVGTGHSRRQRWVAEVREALHADGATTSLTRLAAIAGVERAHLARTFRAVFGCTIGEYTRAVRLERAIVRLGSNDSLARIAADLGFVDQAHFSRAFKAAYGVTPGSWRRAGRAG